jgi:hypothetical protein
MDDRPTEQRQLENQTSSSTTPAAVPMKSGHQQAFLPLNPDYVSPALFPLLEPLQTNDEHHNHTGTVNNGHVEDKDSVTKDGPKKFPGDQKLAQSVATKAPVTPYKSDDIIMTTTTTTEASNVRETTEQEAPKSFDKPDHAKVKNISKTEGTLDPYHVKPPLLPEYEEQPLDDSEHPATWLQLQHQDDKNKHDDSTPHSEDGRSPSGRRPNNPSLDYPINHLNPGKYFIPPETRPVPSPGDVFDIQAVPGSPKFQQQNSPPGHQTDGPSDPHLEQILMHLQRQGILPEHYTIVEQGRPPHEDIPQNQRVQSQEGNVKSRPVNRPVYESDSDDIPIHIHPGSVPHQYIQRFVPKPIPRPGQHPSLYQTGVPRPLLNDRRNILPHPLLPDQYPNHSVRQPDTDGPVVAHVPYQGVLTPHQYHGVPHIPPHVDIDQLLLTSQGRHNQSQSGQFFGQSDACSRSSCVHETRDKVQAYKLESTNDYRV